MNTTTDVERFSFTPKGPWVVDPDAMTWRVDIDELRARTKIEGGVLARPPKVPPVARLARTGALLGSALGGWQLRDRRRGGSTSRAGISRRLRKAFERLGPTYIKLGQIVSAGEGIFP